MSGQIDLGDEVEDVVSGYRGIAVSRTEYLNGCAKYGVQQKARERRQDARIMAH